MIVDPGTDLQSNCLQAHNLIIIDHNNNAIVLSVERHYLPIVPPKENIWIDCTP